MAVQLVRAGITQILVLMLIVAPISAQESGAGTSDDPRSNVVGSVKREDGSPIAGAGIELLDAEGAVITRVETGAEGGYAVPCIPHGQYQIRLDTPEYKGETRAMAVGEAGVQVDWIFGDETKQPLAVATAGGGACLADAPAPDAETLAKAAAEGESWWWRNRYWVGGGVLAVGGGVGLAAGLSGGGGGSSRPASSTGQP